MRALLLPLSYSPILVGLSDRIWTYTTPSQGVYAAIEHHTQMIKNEHFIWLPREASNFQNPESKSGDFTNSSTGQLSLFLVEMTGIEPAQTTCKEVSPALEHSPPNQSFFKTKKPLKQF